MQTTTISTVGRALRRRHWLVWGSAVLAVALALGAAALRPPTYEATALLSVDESADATQGFDTAMQVDQFLTQRYVTMATSQAVLQAVCNKEGRGCSVAALGRQVRVTNAKSAGQLNVVADARTPATAARLANEVARAVVARNATLAQDLVAARRAYLQNQLNQLNSQIGQTLAQANAAEAAGRAGAGWVAQLTAEQTQYSNTYASLQNLDVQTAQMAGIISVQQPALPPARPADPNPLLYALVGGASGFVLGLLATLVAERMRSRVLYATELGEITGSPLVLDLSRRGRPGVSGPGGFLVQAGLARQPGDPRTLALVAASVGDRVDDVAVTLARNAAGEHRRVLVRLALGAGPGPTAPDDSSAVVVVPGTEGGPPPAPPAADEFDLTIYCALPPLYGAAQPWLELQTRTAILVATAGRTRLDEARLTADLLRHVGVEIVGAILLPRSRAARRAQPGHVPANVPVLER